MYILSIAKALKKKMSVNEIGYFIFENCYKRIGFSKENSSNSMKLLKKKGLLLFAIKLIKKYSILVMLKNAINYL